MSTKKIYRGKERNQKEVKNLYFAKNQYVYSHIQEAKLKVVLFLSDHLLIILGELLQFY